MNSMSISLRLARLIRINPQNLLFSFFFMDFQNFVIHGGRS
jgi:hypothetical protein